MRTVNRLIFSAVVSSLFTAGCKVGQDSVLFATNTSIAVDADWKPATLSIAYSRSEAVIEPALENNAVLPVLSSVGVNAGALSFGANHSFATGDAALVMARALTSTKDYDISKLNIALGTPWSDGSDGNPEAKLPAGFIQTKLEPRDRRRVYFGTKTNLGLAVQWSTTTAMPDSVSLGFKRKELAFVPLIDSSIKLDGRTYSGVQLSSLIATANGGTRVGGLNDTGMKIGQLFATGLAATFLSAHGPVRQVLGEAIVPNFEEAKEIAAGLNEAEDVRQVVLDQLVMVYDFLMAQAGDAEAALHVEALNALYPTGLPEAFVFYNVSGATADLTTVGRSDTSKLPRFRRLTAYRSDLVLVIRRLDRAIKSNATINIDPVVLPGQPATKSLADPANAAEYLAELEQRRKQLADVDALLSGKAAADACQYYFDQYILKRSE